MRLSILLAIGLGLPLLGGCTLVDQRTFQRAGETPRDADLARATLPPLPLLTIPFSSPDVDFQPAVQQAADAVLALKPDAEYDVVAPIPINAPQSVQDEAERNGRTDTASVVNALGYAGVSLDKVHVGFRSDGGTPPREVLVFVR
jgi:hypothetical protein